ncbi:plac8 onzin related protein 6 [Colossoma macropomum]|uniref:plac8 onzin related protein 6 n=1 Tax=Colossoma macropomum TaxID=42526 RepID=UPI0018643104|nr:plac8 onzin related protein 6 [Colossoma macropomum]
MMAVPTVMMQPVAFQSPDSPKTGQWSSGICDCCEDMSTCCLGFWCPCCLMCNTSERFGECFCLPLVQISFGVPLTFAMRSSVRERYRIQGTMFNDCCVSTCCAVCVWCQIARELKHRQKPQVIVNASVSPAYQPPLPNTPQQPQFMAGH